MLKVILEKSNLIRKIFLFSLLSNIFSFNYLKAETTHSFEKYSNQSYTNINREKNDYELKNLENEIPLNVDYLNSKEELNDYIIGFKDEIFLQFTPKNEFSGIYKVNNEGEIFLPRLEETFVRGLTTSELSKLLEKKYSEYLINPQIKARIVKFKPINISIIGEVRSPGFYKFDFYQTNKSNLEISKKNEENEDLIGFNESLIKGSDPIIPDSNRTILNTIDPKVGNDGLITIADAIRKANGITSKTDLSKVEIIREVPLSKGGGKKRAIVDLSDYLEKGSSINNLRLFDGDIISIKSKSIISKEQIPKSIISGLSPKFISVNIFGRVETPGVVKVPLESTLSDAIDLTGPIKPLSGKIILIRYKNDGNILKLNIPYSANARRGSKKNPFIKEGDLITVKNSFLGKSTAIISEVTAPFIGIYSTKELIDSF